MRIPGRFTHFGMFAGLLELSKLSRKIAFQHILFLEISSESLSDRDDQMSD